MHQESPRAAPVLSASLRPELCPPPARVGHPCQKPHIAAKRHLNIRESGCQLNVDRAPPTRLPTEGGVVVLRGLRSADHRAPGRDPGRTGAHAYAGLSAAGGDRRACRVRMWARGPAPAKSSNAALRRVRSLGREARALRTDRSRRRSPCSDCLLSRRSEAWASCQRTAGCRGSCWSRTRSRLRPSGRCCSSAPCR